MTEKTTEKKVKEKAELSTTAYFAQCMSRPTTLTEYLADKVLTGLMAGACVVGINAAIDHYKNS